MKTGLIRLFAVWALMFQGAVFAQGESAVPFLLLQPGPAANGMAGAVTALPYSSAYGFYYNPALSGVFAKNSNFAFTHSKVNWLPQSSIDLHITSGAFSVGYNFNRPRLDLPLQIGISGTQFYLDYGHMEWTDEQGNLLGTFHSKEFYNALNVGAQLDLRLKIAFGLTFKQYYSLLSSLNTGSEQRNAQTDGNVYDVGLLLRFPFFPGSEPSFNNKKRRNFRLLPLLSLSLGAVLNNLGGEVVYRDGAQADPLPRQAKLGIGVTAGLASWIHNVYVTWFNLSYSSEANDLLVQRSTDGTYSYQNFPGDIRMIDHMVLSKGDEQVINRKGAELNVMDVLKIRLGSWYGHGFQPRVKSVGFSIGSRGILNAVTAFSNISAFKRFFNHYELEYTWVRYRTDEKDHPLNDSEFRGFSLKVYGF